MIIQIRPIILVLLCSRAYCNSPQQPHLPCASYQVPNYNNWDGSYVPVIKCVLCKAGFQLIDGFCYCAEGTFLNLDNISFGNIECKSVPSAVNCIEGVYKSGALACNNCGYGTKLNPSTKVCQCSVNRTMVQGGCTSIFKCLVVSYPSSKTERCLSCDNTFLLQEGECICPSTTKYNSLTGLCQDNYNRTSLIPGCIKQNGQDCVQCGNGLSLSAGSCICTGFNVSGGCTSIPGCNYIRYPTPQTQECISCKDTFTLQMGKCICSAGSYYDITIDSCKQTAKSSNNTNGPSNSDSNSFVFTDTQIAITLSVFGILILIILILTIFLLIKSANNNLTKTLPHDRSEQIFTQSIGEIGEHDIKDNQQKQRKKKQQKIQREFQQTRNKKRMRIRGIEETVQNIDLTITNQK